MIKAIDKWILREDYKVFLFIFSLPLFHIIYSAEAGLYGVDAGKAVVHAAGQWAVIFLILSLSATPVLRVFKLRSLMKYRRQTGLWTLFYTCSHFIFYFLFLLADWSQFLADLSKRPYIIVGALALVMLIVLGVTSTKAWQRRLKSKWLTLHKAVYLIAILTGIHWWMTLRSDIGEWILYMTPLAILLGWRLYKKVTK